jgi:zinc/manganese transport system substrate-binding protein
MLNRRIFLACALSTPVLAQAPQKIQVIASFSILADLIRVIGGTKTQVTSLVGLNQDAHHYSPRPNDIKLVSAADIFIINGLGFENWADKLLNAANFKNTRLVASQGVKALKTGNSIDPHAFHDIQNVKLYTKNIAVILSTHDKTNASFYEANMRNYHAQLEGLENEIKAMIAQIPRGARKVVTSHDAFAYYGDAYDIDFYAPVGKIITEPTAENIAKIIKQIKAENIKALFIENMSNPRALKQISNETDVKIGGTLYADALSAKAPSYLEFMRYNTSVLTKSLK